MFFLKKIGITILKINIYKQISMKDIFKNIIKKKKIGLIIYARMSSKRFPGKVLKKIYNNLSVCEIIINKLNKTGLKSNIIIATSKNKTDNKIVTFCKKNKIKYFLGSNKDVFQRTTKCIEKYKFKYFVRICADRPLFDTDLMIRMIKLILLKNYDIVTNVHPRTYPKGLTCEVAKTNIFEKINLKDLTLNDKEHIFNYFYRNKNFKIYNIRKKFKKKFLSKNFCIDTKNDVKKIREILVNFDNSKKEVNTENLLRYS